MSDEMDGVDKAEEPLADAAPVEEGAPKPVEPHDPVLSLLGGVGVAMVALGGLILAVLPNTRNSREGATRSAHVQMEQRAAEIRRALAENQSILAADAMPAAEPKLHEGNRKNVIGNKK